MKFWKKKNSSNSEHSTESREYVAEALEPRILFSGAPVEADMPDATTEAPAEAENGAGFESTEGFDGQIPVSEVDSTLSENVILTSYANLSEDEIRTITEAAIERWKATGLTDDQIEVLEAIEISIVDLEGLSLGAAEGYDVYLDIDAAGNGWFIDETPFLDEEFDFAESSTSFRATEGDAVYGMDLLTVMMHEMGHVLGLEDISAELPDNLMFEELGEGERRIAADGQAEGVEAGSLEGIHYLAASGTPGDAAVYTIDSGSTVTIEDAPDTATNKTNAHTYDFDTETLAPANDSFELNAGAEISLTAGHHLVLYNAQWDSINDRAGLETHLKINGAASNYGSSAGYSRNLSDNEVFTSGGTIINVNQGDSLELESIRTDVYEVDEPRDITLQNAGIQLVKLDDSLDYLRLGVSSSSQIFTGNSSDSGPANVSFTTSDEVDTDSFGHSVSTNADEITLKNTGYYLVFANTGFEVTSSNQRQSITQQLTLNNNEVAGSASTVYLRNASSNDASGGLISQGAASIGTIVQVTDENSILSVSVERDNVNSASSVDIDHTNTGITIVHLPAYGDYITLEGASQDVNVNGGTTMDFSISPDVTTTSFTYDAVTSNSKVSVNEAGNYLFLNSYYVDDVDTAGTDARTTVEQGFQVTPSGGSASRLNYGTGGSYNRDDNAGADQSRDSGNWSGAIVSLGANDAVEVYTQRRGTSASPLNATGGVYLQGINIASISAEPSDPVVATNAPLNVLINETGIMVDNTFLSTLDSNTGAASLTYTITSIPDGGTFYLSGSELGFNDTFTQQDIDNNLITFDAPGVEFLGGGFEFSVSDGGPNPASGTFVVNTGVAMAAQDDTGTTDEDTPLSAVNPASTTSLLDNDSGTSLAVISSDTTSALGAIVTVNLDGTFVYTPTSSSTLNALDTGDQTIDTFTYTVRDFRGIEDTRTATITVNGVNDAPKTINETVEITDRNGASLNLLDNESDVEPGDSQTLTGIAGYTFTGSHTFLTPQGATLTINNDGSASYDVSTSANILALTDGASLSESFTYSVSDGTDESTATVTFVSTGTVGASNDVARVAADATVEIAALANDTVTGGTVATATGGALIEFLASTASNTNTAWTNTGSVNTGTPSITVAGGTLLEGGSLINAPAGITAAYSLSGGSAANNDSGAIFTDIGDPVAWPGAGDNLDVSDATIELVFRPSDQSGEEVLFETGGATVGSSIVLVGNQIVATMSDADNYAMQAVATLPEGAVADGEFVHLMVLFNIGGGSDSIEIFVNNTPAGSATVQYNLAAADGSNTSVDDWSGTDDGTLGRSASAIGGDNSLGNFGTIDVNNATDFTGEIATLRIYYSLLTTTELNANFESVFGNTSSATVGNVITPTVETPVTLASGAQVTLNADDGTFTYDPNGAFDTIEIGETAVDTFTYQLDSDVNSEATVTVTIDGTASNLTSTNLVQNKGFLTGSPSVDLDDLVVSGAVQVTPGTLISGTDPDFQTVNRVTQQNIGEQNHANGLTFEIEITPETSDLTGTVPLIEIGGGSNGTGIYLVNGIPTVIGKMNSNDQQNPDVTQTRLADDGTTELIHDLNFDSNGTNTNGVITVQHASGALSTGTSSRIVLIYNPVGDGTIKFSVNGYEEEFTFENVNGRSNWSGDDTVSVGDSPGTGAGGISNVSGSMDFFNASETKSLAGNLESASYFNDTSGWVVPTSDQVTATLTLSDVSAGSLTATSGNGETYDSGTGMWTITGDTTAVNSALAALTFIPSGSPADASVSVNIVDDVADTLASPAPVIGSIAIDYVPVTISPAIATENGDLEFVVTLNEAAPTGGVTVTFSTSDGTAVAGSDFVSASGSTISIAAGETSGTITVATVNDAANESVEDLTVTITGLSGFDGAASTGLTIQETGTIVDNEVIYVDDSFSGTIGDPLTDADSGTTGDQAAIFGVNAFATIEEALAAVDPSGTIIVNEGTYSEDLVISGTVTIEVTGDDTSQSATISGQISGTGNLVKTGVGTLTLSSANTYSGTTSIVEGTLIVDGEIGNGSPAAQVSISANAVLSGEGKVNAAINGSSNSTIETSGDLDLGNPGDPAGFQTTGNIIVNNGDTLTLQDSGVSQLGTSTLLLGGTLTAGNNYSLSSGDEISGTGTINGNITVNSGTLSPGTTGDEEGVLTINGSVNFASSSTIIADLNGTGTPGIDFDQLVISGTVDIDGATLDLSGSTITGPLTAGTEIILIQNGGGAVTGTPASFVNLPEGAAVTVNDEVFTISYTGGNTGGPNDVVLSYAGTAETGITLNGSELVVEDVNGTTDSNDTISVSIVSGYYRLHDPSLLLGTNIEGAIQIDENTVDIPIGGITAVTINTQAGNDTLTLDYSGGDLGVPITFNGGNPTSGPGDKLVITGGTFGTLTHNLTSADSGNIDFDGAGGAEITYTGLEPVDTTGSTVTDYVFNLPNVVNQAKLSITSAGTNEMTLESLNATFESTVFTAPSGSITINGGTEADSIQVDDVSSATTDFYANAGNGNDTVTLTDANNTGLVRIYTENGDDVVEIYDAHSTTLRVDDNDTASNAGTEGHGSDTITLHDSHTSGETRLASTNGGTGNNDTFIVNNANSDSLFIRGYGGDDSLTINDTNTIGETIFYGDNNYDPVIVNKADGGGVNLIGGNQDDEYFVGGAIGAGNLDEIDTTVRIDGSGDTDTVFINDETNTTGRDFAFHNNGYFITLNGTNLINLTNSGRNEGVVFNTGTGTDTLDMGSVTFGVAGATSVTFNDAGGGITVSADQPTILGDLNLDANTTLSFDLKGTTPGTTATDHDQIIVSGTARLNNANLDAVLSYVPTLSPADSYVILTAGVIDGTFNGLADGATFTSNGVVYQINYTATEVTLTIQPPAVVFVDADTFTAGGTAVDGDQETTDSEPAVVGYNAFANIGDAFANLDPTQDGTIIVNAGDYSADAVDLTTFPFSISLQFVEGDSTVGSITTGSDDVIALGGFDGNHTAAVDVTFGSDNSNTTIAGALTGTGDLIKTGTGTVTLSQPGTSAGGLTNASGNTIVNSGVLVWGANDAFPDGTVTVESGATVDLTALSGSNNGATGTQGSNRAYIIEGTGSAGQGALINSTGDIVGSATGVSGLTLTGDATINTPARLDIGGAIDLATYTLTKTGGNSLAFRATVNSPGASIEVNAGLVYIENNNMIVDTVTVNDGARFGMYNYNDNTRSVTADIVFNGTSALANDTNVGGNAEFNGTITVNGTTTITDTFGTVNGTEADVIVNSDISGPGNIIYTGTASDRSIEVNGTNSYTGTTTITNGNIYLNGIHTGGDTYTVMSGAVLAGNGSTDSVVTVQDGAILSAGLASGDTTDDFGTGTLTLADTAVIEVELGGTADGEYDQVVVNGDVNPGSATLLLSSSFAPANGDSFVIIDNQGSNPVNGIFEDAAGNDYAEGATVSDGTNSYIITYAGGDGNDVVLFAGAAETEVSIDGSGNLVITDINGGVSNDDISIDFDGTNYTISDPNLSLTTSIAGATRPDANTVVISAALVTGGIELNTLGNAGATATDIDTVDFTGTFTINGNLVLNGAEAVQVDSDAILDFDTPDTHQIQFNGGDNTIYITGGGQITDFGSIVETVAAGTNDIVFDFGTLGDGSEDITADNLFLNPDNPDGNLTYVRNGGTLTIHSNLQLGGEGGGGNTGNIRQSGGIVNVGGDLLFGGASTGSNMGGTYNLDGGALNVTGDIIEGASTGANAAINTAQLHVDGGNLSVDGDITVQRFAIGQDTGSTGSYSIAAGQTVTSTGTTSIGSNGTGTLDISAAGAKLISTNAYVGESPTGDGTVTMTASDGSWEVAQFLIIGQSGKGDVTITDGLLDAQGTSGNPRGIIVGRYASGDGTLTIGDGATTPVVNVSGGNTETGLDGKGHIIVNSGTYNQLDSNIIVGQTSNANSIFEVNGGTVNAANQLRINEGTGLIDINDGIVNVASTLDLVNGAGGALNNATLDVSGGTLNVATDGGVNTGLYVGNYDETGYTAVFNQSGGVVNITGTGLGGLRVAYNGVNSSGSANLTGGVLNVSGSNTEIGQDGTGSLTVDGGTLNQLTNNIVVGQVAGSNGTVTLDSGIIDVQAGDLNIANAGNGSFTQNGGTLDVALIQTGNVPNAGVTGSFILIDGTATARSGLNNAEDLDNIGIIQIGDGTTTPTLTVGGGNFESAVRGDGTVEVRSGTVDITGSNFITGQNTGSVATVTVGGYSAPATINTTGTGTLGDWNTNGGLGIVNVLANGTINIGNDINMGSSADANSGLELTINGGSVNVGTGSPGVGNIDFRSNGPRDQINLQSGELTGNGGTINLSTHPDSAFSFTGGTLRNFGTFTNANLSQDSTSSGSVLDIGPEDNTGTMTINGDYTLTEGTVHFDINGATTPGTDHDQLVVNGAVNLGAAANITFDLGYTPTAGDQITLITSTNETGVFANYPDSDSDGRSDPFELNNGSGDYVFQINYAGGTGNDVVLEFVGVAETSVEVTGGELVITDINNDSGDDLTISFDSGVYTITDSFLVLTTTGGPGITRVNGNTITVDAAQIPNGIRFEAAAGAANQIGTVTVENLPSVSGDLTIHADTINLNGDVVTTGDQDYNGATVLTDDVTLAGVNVTFESTVDGAFALDVDASGVAVFVGDVGTVTPLTSIDTDGSASTEFGVTPAAPTTPLPTLNYDANLPGNTSDAWNSTTSEQSQNWDLTAANGVALVDVSGTTAVQGISQAYRFTGDGDNAGPENLGLNDIPGDPSNNSASWEFWIRPTDTGDADQLIYETGGSGDGMAIWYSKDTDNDGTGTIKFTIDDGGVQVTVSAAISTSEFSQIVAVYEQNDADNGGNDRMELFINGVSVASDVTQTALDDWDGGDTAGLGSLGAGGLAQTVNNGQFNGDISIYRFYEVALTDPDIVTTFDAVNGQAPVAPISVNTTGDQTYGDQSIAKNAMNFATSAGNVNFSGTLDDDGDDATASAISIATSAANSIEFTGAVGSTNSVQTLTTTGGGEVTISNSVETQNQQDYSGDVTVENNGAIVEAENGYISIGGNLNGLENVTINALGGNLTVTGAADLDGTSNSFTAANDTDFTGVFDTTGPTTISAGASTYFRDNVLLGDDLTVNAANNVEFIATLTGTVDSDVTLNANTLSRFGGIVSTGSITTDRPGRTEIEAGITLTGTAASSFNDQVLVTGTDVTIETATGSGDLTFNHTIDSETGETNNLTLTLNGGDVYLNGDIGEDHLEALSNDSGLGNFLIDGSNGKALFGGRLNTAPGTTTVLNYIAGVHGNLDGTLNDLTGLAAANLNFNVGGNVTFDNNPETNFAGITGAYTFPGGAADKATAASFESAPTNPSNSDSAYEFWFKPDDFSDANAQLIWESGGQNAGSNLALQGSVLTFTAKEAENLFGQVSFDLSLLSAEEQGDFIQATLVYNVNTSSGGLAENDRIDLYVNGVLRDTLTNLNLDDIIGTDPTGLGGPNTLVGGTDTNNVDEATGDTDTAPVAPTDTFEGQIAVVRVYNGLLNSTDVQNSFDFMRTPLTVTTSGDQTYGVDVCTEGTLFNGANITFDEALDSTNPTNHSDVIVNLAEGGTATFAGTVGGNEALASLTTTGKGTVVLSGDTVTVSESATFYDAVELGTDISIINTGDGDVHFGSTVDSAAGDTYNLVVDTNLPGTTIFSGDVGVTNSLGSITTDEVGFGTGSFENINIASVTFTALTDNNPADGWTQSGTSGYGDITFPGDVTVSTNASSYPGITDAYNFNGTPATMDALAVLGNAENESATWEIWFKPDDLTGNEVLFETGGTGNGTSLNITGNEFLFATQTGSTNHYELRGTLPADATSEFVHALVTWDSTTKELELYINGEQSGATLSAPNLSNWDGGDNASMGGLGSAHGGGSGLSGYGAYQGDIAIFNFYQNQVLTSSEIEQNFLAVAGSTEPVQIVTSSSNGESGNQSFGTATLGVDVTNTGENVLYTDTISLNDNDLTIDVIGNDSEAQGEISGTGAVTKTGSGTFTTTADNVYTGTTSIDEGSLIVNGSHIGGGDYSVAATAILGGEGTIGSTGTITGGIVAPGDQQDNLLDPDDDSGIGTLTVNDNITVGGMNVEIDGDTKADLLDVIGTVTLGGTLTLEEITAGAPAVGSVITLINNDGTDAITGTFTGLPEGATITDDDGNSYIISYAYDAGGDGNANDVVLFAGAPETQVELTAGGVLSITDINNDSSDSLSITYDASTNTYTIVEANGTLLISTLGLTADQVTRPDAQTVIVDANAIPGGVTGLEIDTTGVTPGVESSDTVTFATQNGTMITTGDVSITAYDVDFAAGALIESGGSVSINAERQIDLQDGASITTTTGDVTLTANPNGTAGGGFAGIDLKGNNIITTTDGNITFSGEGGGNVNSKYGVLIRTGSTVSSTGNGAISITGVADGTDDNNRGVWLQNNATVQVNNGTLTMTGTGGGGVGGDTEDTGNYGLHIQGQVVSVGSGNISMTGTAGGEAGTDPALIYGKNNHGILIASLGDVISSGTGTILIDGTGGAGADANRGVWIDDGTTVTSANGDITILAQAGGGVDGGLNNQGLLLQGGIETAGAANLLIRGTGGGSDSAASNNNDGVRLSTAGANITSTGTGTITVEGTGGAANSANHGIRIVADTYITSETGDIVLTGTGGNGTRNNTNNNDGIFVLGSVSSTGAATVTLNGTGGGTQGANNDINDGVTIGSTGAVSSAGGLITITGVAGGDPSNNSSDNDGVIIEDGGTVSTTNLAGITITGTGGSDEDGDGVIIRGADSAVSSEDGDISIEGTGEDGVEIAAGVTAPVTSTGSGNITICGESTALDVANGNVGTQIDSAISSGTGNVTLASVDSIIFGDDGDVTSTSGTVSITADKDNLTNGGEVIMSGGTLVDAGTGNIDLDADGDVTLTGLTAGGTIAVDSTNGNLTAGQISAGGNITFNVSDNFNLDSSGSITSSGGAVTINVDLNGTPDAEGSIVSILGTVGAGGGQTVSITGGSDNDIFNITPSTTSVIEVDGGSPSAPINEGDILNIINGNNPVRTPDPLVAGQGTFSFDGGQQDINYTDIERDSVPSLEIDIPISQRLLPTTLNGEFTDFGLDDSHMLTVDWKDGTSTFDIPSFNGGLTAGMVIPSTTDGAQLTIVSADPTTGEVEFTVSHTYATDGLYDVEVSVVDSTAARTEANQVAEVYFLAPSGGNGGFFSDASLPGRFTLSGFSGLFNDLRFERLFATDELGNDVRRIPAEYPRTEIFFTLDGEVRVVYLTGVEYEESDLLTALNNSILNGTPLDLLGNELSVDSMEVLQAISDLIRIDVDGVED